MNITEFVINECVRQSATEPKDYIGMTRACCKGIAIRQKINFRYANGIHLADILMLGQMVNSQDDMFWRSVTARFNNGNEGAPYSQIPRLLEQLLDMQERLAPEEFYWEFERIHPFADGNGRVGAILFNIVSNNSMWVTPPEMVW